MMVLVLKKGLYLMGCFDGILICTDLDGTLYRNDKSVSKENLAAIEFFKKEGGYFTFITGRMPYYAGNALKLIEPNAPFGCINGGGLYDHIKGEYVWNTELDRKAFELVEYIERLYPTVGIQVSAFYYTFFHRYNDAMENFRAVAALPDIQCHYREVTEPVGKVIFATFDEEEIQGVERALRSHPLAGEFDFIRSERTLFEILPKGVSKGVSITKLSEHLKIDVSKTVAVGDYNNDVPMLLAAGLGVAVGNACQAAKEAADLVTVTNEEDAIAKIIYDIRDGKIAL